jgi:hypothetical protein
MKLFIGLVSSMLKSTNNLHQPIENRPCEVTGILIGRLVTVRKGVNALEKFPSMYTLTAASEDKRIRAVVTGGFLVT